MPQQGDTFAATIKAELDREYQRAATVDSRASTAITSAVSLATLTAAAAAAVISKSDWLQGASAVTLIAGVLMLLVAGVFAVIAGVSFKHNVISVDTLQDWCTNHWKDPEIDASSLVTQSQIDVIKSLRDKTSIKAGLLVTAQSFQVVAIAFLVTTLIIIVSGH